tara:strand:+ start:528 stop:632 length:105 start_codon:yes stop_codon:yes gene_type:complete
MNASEHAGAKEIYVDLSQKKLSDQEVKLLLDENK